MASEQRQAAADDLYAARRDRRTIDPIAGRFDIAGADAAYDVQEINTERRIAEGGRLIGRKIGLTSVVVQEQLGVKQPDYGMLFADMARVDGEDIAADRLIQPRAEAEIAIVMERAVEDPDIPFPVFQTRIAGFLPAIEIVDSAIADWRISFEDTVADNASSGLFVIGRDLVRQPSVPLELAGMTLSRNGEVQSHGVGAACLGHPLAAAHWLAVTMADRGRPLQPGDIVLTGALGPMVPLVAGDHFEARICGLGSLGARMKGANE